MDCAWESGDPHLVELRRAQRKALAADRAAEQRAGRAPWTDVIWDAEGVPQVSHTSEVPLEDILEQAEISDLYATELEGTAAVCPDYTAQAEAARALAERWRAALIKELRPYRGLLRTLKWGKSHG